MKEKNIDRFPDAILRLAAEYNVTDELKKDVNKPTFAERDATIDEKDGTRIFELNDKFTEDELKVLGPNVKQEHVDALNWHSAKWIGYVKDRKVKCNSTSHNTAPFDFTSSPVVLSEKKYATTKLFSKGKIWPNRHHYLSGNPHFIPVSTYQMQPSPGHLGLCV